MAESHEVEVVIVNWRRPGNIPAIIHAFREQTVPCSITLCDAGGPQFGIPESGLALADSAFVLKRNYGCFNRYIPSFAFDSEFCWFHDDDMLPGPELLANLLSCRGREFSVLGQSGRRIAGDNYICVNPSADFQKVDFVCRGYFVRTALLYNILRFKQHINLRDRVIIDDDILLAASIHAYTGLDAWVIPTPPPEARMNSVELLAPHACQEMPDHYSRRKQFFKSCVESYGSISR